MFRVNLESRLSRAGLDGEISFKGLLVRLRAMLLSLFAHWCHLPPHLPAVSILYV